MDKKQLFCLHEEIREKDFIIATYYMELAKDINVLDKAANMAIGQTVGTWIPVPGITEEMQKNHMGKVVNILDIPPFELLTQTNQEKVSYLIQIAYPTVNFGAQFPMMLTTLLGNDASTSAQVKLVDLLLPKKFAESFYGPKFGIEGIRNLVGVHDRPLILNMIKPCTGFTPEVGAKIFYQTALGGADFIKDDELLGNPDFCPAVERVKAYHQAAKAAYEKTGKKTVYIVNITDVAERLIDNAKRVVEAGAEAIMVNFATVGYGMLHAMAKEVDVPILGHYAGSGMFYEGVLSGMSSPIAIGKLPRLAGADIVMINTPYGGYPLKFQKYIQTVHELTLPYYQLKPVMPAVGGGVHPGLVEKFIKELGTDIILSPGGAVHGHPMGAAAGVRAMRQAVDAVLEGIPLDEYAKDKEELRTALQVFGYKR